MYQQVDLENWPRKGTFELFRDYEHPFFNLTATVDVGRFYEFCRDTHTSFFLGSLFLSLKVANSMDAFRYRLRGPESVICWDEIDGGSTVLKPDKSFTFCYFDYSPSLKDFCEAGAERVATIIRGNTFEPRHENDRLIHYSVVPWVAFTSIQHARRHSTDDSIPKLVFGKHEAQGARRPMPVSVELHHALADGYHVGEFFEAFQQVLNTPELH